MGANNFLSGANFADPKIKIIYPDPRISAGTVFLFDPTHSAGLVTGVPVNNAPMPNIAKEQAAILTGQAPTALDGTFITSTQSASAFYTERTAKGGLLMLPSQSIQSGANYMLGRFPAVIQSYILNAIPGANAFYVWLWIVKLRNQINTAANAALSYFIQNTSINVFLWKTTDNYADDLGGGIATGTYGLNTPLMTDVGFSAWKGTKPATPLSALFSVGSGIDAFGGTNMNKAPGYILYGAGIENLAYTKRANNGLGGTYAEEFVAARAAVSSHFTKCFSVGGKFYNDTWTSNLLATYP